jgi:hypothetical protein
MGVIRDPIDFAATIIIDAAADKGQEVTGESIAEALAICHLEPGSQMYQATWGAKFENTRAEIIELLESSGRSAMIGAARATNRGGQLPEQHLEYYMGETATVNSS